jgi:hypothetical protein
MLVEAQGLNSYPCNCPQPYLQILSIGLLTSL